MRPVPTITIVEDDEAVRDSLAELLRSYGFEVRGYNSALAFLSDLRSDHSDSSCVISDLHMPGMNGLELLELLRTRNQRMPMILVTGRSDSALKERARRCEAVAVLDKPVSEDALLDAISRALNKTLETPHMHLKSIRLELARSAQHPQGDAQHAYVFRAPLDLTGHLDADAWQSQRDLCTVHRFDGGREVETGTLRRSSGGRWVFSYLPGTEDDEPIFRLSKHVFAPGEYVTITEHDGVERTFKVASVEDWHPGAPRSGSEKAGDRRAGI